MEKVDAVDRGSVEPQPAALIKRTEKNASTNQRQFQRRGSARIFFSFQIPPEVCRAARRTSAPLRRCQRRRSGRPTIWRALVAGAVSAAAAAAQARQIPPELMSAAGIHARIMAALKARRPLATNRRRLSVSSARRGCHVAQLRTRSKTAQRSWSRVPAARRRHPSPARGCAWLPSRQLDMWLRSSLVPRSILPARLGVVPGGLNPQTPARRQIVATINQREKKPRKIPAVASHTASRVI